MIHIINIIIQYILSFFTKKEVNVDPPEPEPEPEPEPPIEEPTNLFKWALAIRTMEGWY